MKHTHIRKHELNTAAWKGGTTTQLFIYPPGTTYMEFNFDFRMSYATVEIPESTFTFMPGVTRHLMILKGELEIDHTDRYKKILKKFDADVFNGEWPTTAKGMVMDFNLMTRNQAEGKIDSLILHPSETRRVALPEKFCYAGFYVLAGQATIDINNTTCTLETGDFMLVAYEKRESLSVQAVSAIEIVTAFVKNG